MDRYRVGVLGATGAVGQRLVAMLANHPWFQLSEVVASARSAGQRYADAVEWRLDTPLPEDVGRLMVRELECQPDCDLLISGLDSSVAGAAEEHFAAQGWPVISNSSNHRMDPDVPLVIPEVNPDHLDLLPAQQQQRRWEGGFIVTNPNCAAIGLTMALKPLHDSFGVDHVSVVTMQAISGAGNSGVAAAAIQDNVIPYIAGEEEKLEREPLKLLGSLEGGRIQLAQLSIDAHCNRVPVLDGHIESVSVRLRRPVELGELRDALEQFVGEPQRRALPTAPVRPIVVMSERDRPQPRLDRAKERGMLVSVGRLRLGAEGQVKFSVLSHNAVRGAAGAALLNAELLCARGVVRRSR